MPVTNYRTLNGRMRGQATAGARTDYLTDAIGSVTATVTASAVVENTYRHKPYGGRLSKTGTGIDPRFLWTGDTGSRSTGASNAEQYNLARHYGSKQATWTIVDPLWPSESPYGYVGGGPTTWIDPEGLYPKYSAGCGEEVRKKINKLCDLIKQLDKYGNIRSLGEYGSTWQINQCIKRTRAVQPGLNCQTITDKRVTCMQTWCEPDGILTCGEIPGGEFAGYCPGTPTLWGHALWNMDRVDPAHEILVDPSVEGNTFAYTKPGFVVTVIHELMHACGQLHNSSRSERQCNDVQACCINEVVSLRRNGSRCWSRMPLKGKYSEKKYPWRDQ